MDCHKFRVWNETKNEYMKLKEGYWANIGSEGELVIGRWDEVDDIYPEENKLIVERCTGLKDKNGKLIYEGDILKFETESGWQSDKVEWDDRGMWLPLRNDDYTQDELGDWFVKDENWDPVFEIIGNVHDKTLDECIAEAKPNMGKVGSVDEVMKELRGENTSACPQCGAEQEDADGFGVLHCQKCGYCKHASRTEGKCDACGEVYNG